MSGLISPEQSNRISADPNEQELKSSSTIRLKKGEIEQPVKKGPAEPELAETFSAEPVREPYTFAEIRENVPETKSVVQESIDAGQESSVVHFPDAEESRIDYSDERTDPAHSERSIRRPAEASKSAAGFRREEIIRNSGAVDVRPLQEAAMQHRTPEEPETGNNRITETAANSADAKISTKAVPDLKESGKKFSPNNEAKEPAKGRTAGGSPKTEPVREPRKAETAVSQDRRFGTAVQTEEVRIRPESEKTVSMNEVPEDSGPELKAPKLPNREGKEDAALKPEFKEGNQKSALERLRGTSRNTEEIKPPVKKSSVHSITLIEEQEKPAARKRTVFGKKEERTGVQKSGDSRSPVSRKAQKLLKNTITKRTGNILRLNHPSFIMSDDEDSFTDEDDLTSDNGEIRNRRSASERKIRTVGESSKISTFGSRKSTKISVDEMDSEKVSTELKSAKKRKILTLNRDRKAIENILQAKGPAAPAVKVAGGGKGAGAAGAAGGGAKNPFTAPFIFIGGLILCPHLLRIILVALAALLILNALSQNPRDAGVDKATYLVTKYSGNESLNIVGVASRFFGTFAFSEDKDIMDLVDFLYNKRNDEGHYNKFKNYTSEYKSEYSRADRLALHALWLAQDFHYIEFLQDQQRYMIDRYYLQEEEWIEKEYEIDLAGASYALKAAILSLNFTFSGAFWVFSGYERGDLYDDIDWLGPEEDIIETLYDNAVRILEEDGSLDEDDLERARKSLTAECWDAIALYDGVLDIYERDNDEPGTINWSGHEETLILGAPSVDNLHLSPEPPTGIVSTKTEDQETERTAAHGGLADGDIFGPVTGGGYYLDNRMPYLFPNGVPNSPQEMSQYLTTVPCETCNRGTVFVTVHKLLAAKVQAAFHEMAEIGFPISSDTYGYGWRNAVTVTSSGQAFRSHHSYGVVVDLNANSNYMVKNGQVIAGSHWLPGEDPYSVTQEVVDIWKRQGFLWGGEFPDSRDYMHFTFTGH